MKKQEMLKRDKLLNQKGITLVTLIVTIIIMLILASVTITIGLSDTGIIQKAKDTANLAELDTIKEKIQLDILDALANSKEDRLPNKVVEDILNKYGDVTYEQDGTTPNGVDTDKGHINLEDILENVRIS